MGDNCFACTTDVTGYFNIDIEIIVRRVASRRSVVLLSALCSRVPACLIIAPGFHILNYFNYCDQLFIIRSAARSRAK